MLMQQARGGVRILAVLIAFLSVAACGVTTTGGPGAEPTATATASLPATPTTFAVTSVDLVVNPSDITGKACGSSASFTYTATFHIPAGSAGGTIQFMYTTTNGRGSTNASVTAPTGATTATYTFTTSGTLLADHTFPGIAEVSVTSPSAVNSPQVSVTGACTSASAFTVTGIDMAVQPTTINGIACGATLSVTWTATFHLPSNGPGGVIHLSYSWNEGRGSSDASVTVPPNATTAMFSFVHTDKVLPDHSFPQNGVVQVTNPNVLTSPELMPSGNCHS